MNAAFPSRDPPKLVTALLRQEVNFGCPVRYANGDGCGCPMLTYHHFDPPWAGKFVHNPEGMVALCPTHHDQADGGSWTAKQLRDFKKRPYVDSAIKCRWPWTAEKLIVQFGPNLTLTEGSPLWLYEKPILGFRPQTNLNYGNEVVIFNSYIEDRAGQPWMRIEDNSLSLETASTQDFIFRPQTTAFSAHNRGGTQLHGRFRHVPCARFEDWWKGFNRGKRFNRDNGYAAARDFLDKFNVVDSDGRIPIVSVTGEFTTRHVSVKITPRSMTIQCLAFGPAGFTDILGHIFRPGTDLRLRDADQDREFLRLG